MKFFVLVAMAVGALLGCATSVKHNQELNVPLVAAGVPVAVNPEAPAVEGRPQTAVVVTQCDQLVVAYLTMPSGELVRFDKDTGLPWETVLEMAYTAARSERVQVECTGTGVEGYETHTPEINI